MRSTLISFLVLCCSPLVLFSLPAFALSDDELASMVTIRRDTYGVPHLLADTEEAAAFGYGFAAAEDHVLVIARLYLKARSEEAEYFGEDFIESDLLMKQLHVYKGAEIGFSKTAPWFQRILDGYARGFNRYVAQRRDELPMWVKPISGIDVMAHARRVIVVEFCMNLEQLQALGETQTARIPETPYYEVGSNMWAIGSGRSETGNAILLGNPHLLWSGSHLWHEVHTTVPGEINFLGAALVGFPGAGLGFNEHLGWSHTVNPHDCSDIYQLTLDPENPLQYIYDGQPVPLGKETLSIRVKTDNGIETIERESYTSHFGPVVAIKGNKGFAFKAANIDEYLFVQQWYMMTKATTLEEFRNIVDMQSLPMFNIGYADDQGNCFYLFNGRFPDRPAGYDWSGIVPGDSSKAEWTSVLPQHRLPSLTNPPGDYIQNSNSAPWYTNLNAIIDKSKYPEHLSPPGNSLRTQLGLEMIEADTSMTLEEIKQYKYNTKLLLADRVKQDLVHIAQGRTVDAVELDDAVNLLTAWDNTVSAESIGSVLFVQFWRAYREQADPVYAVPFQERNPSSTPHGIGDADTALRVLAATVRTMQTTFGTLEVPWGDLFRFRDGKLDLSIGGFTGDFGAFRVLWFTDAEDGTMTAIGGDSYVFVVEFSDPIEAYNVLAYSQSDDPNSPHFDDQARLFTNGRWKAALFSEEAIAQNLERSYHP